MDLLDLFGSEYVIDHVVAEHNSKFKQEAYYIYTSEMLKALAESWGATVNVRYTDLITKDEEEEKTGDEIALEVITKLGLKGKQDDPTGFSSEDFA